ncbi:hypothetical protein EQV77_10430 [Halobacillus fulvus]|nr:hypothetical protein EQV77_10430 [Halobacillus fulvus]
MKYIGIFSILIVLVLGACSSADDTTSGAENEDYEVASLPEVEVSFAEEPLPVQEEIMIQAKVTQDGKAVEDAEYVKFEIWNEAGGEDSSVTVETEHVGDGVYEAAYTFESDGIYQMYAHTQVGDVHNMPKTEITVGDAHPSAHEADMNPENDEQMFMVHFMSEEVITAGTETELTAHINHMEQPFKDGRVRFEVIPPESDQHVFLEAEAGEEGEYRSLYTFEEPGTYSMILHYEKPDEDIHGHKEIEVTVQE